mmetsp:Transcript_18469/g.69992  ORF Transcript_18469/g.69992 Transcript_18469/m.69992 type:complete len:255 (+) Transcript_18469:275-1039(+)
MLLSTDSLGPSPPPPQVPHSRSIRRSIGATELAQLRKQANEHAVGGSGPSGGGHSKPRSVECLHSRTRSKQRRGEHTSKPCARPQNLPACAGATTPSLHREAQRLTRPRCAHTALQAPTSCAIHCRFALTLQGGRAADTQRGQIPSSMPAAAVSLRISASSSSAPMTPPPSSHAAHASARTASTSLSTRSCASSFLRACASCSVTSAASSSVTARKRERASSMSADRRCMASMSRFKLASSRRVLASSSLAMAA